MPNIAHYAERAHKITGEMLASIWADKDKNPAHKLKLRMLDSEYLALSESDWAKLALETRTAQHDWKPETRDCDDFAFAFRGLAPLNYAINGVGMVIDISGKHAYNVVVVYVENDDGTAEFDIKVIEPQDDMFVLHKDLGKPPYTMESGEATF